jgi:hypothetical protein
MFKEDNRISRYEVNAIPYVQADGTIAINYELVVELLDMPDTYLASIDLRTKSAEDCIKGINDYLSQTELPENDWFKEILKACSLIAENEIEVRKKALESFSQVN